jgi:hypothetical protein
MDYLLEDGTHAICPGHGCSIAGTDGDIIGRGCYQAKDSGGGKRQSQGDITGFGEICIVGEIQG